MFIWKGLGSAPFGGGTMLKMRTPKVFRTKDCVCVACRGIVKGHDGQAMGHSGAASPSGLGVSARPICVCRNSALSIGEHYKFQNPLLPDTCGPQYLFYVRKGLAWATQSWQPPAPRKVPRPAGVRHLQKWNS